jgi:hypothetical protein
MSFRSSGTEQPQCIHYITTEINTIKIMQKFFHYKSEKRSWERSVSIATNYGLGDQSGQSLSPSRVKNFLFSMFSRPTLGPTQSPMQWVLGAKIKKNMDLHIHSPIHLHGIVLN